MKFTKQSLTFVRSHLIALKKINTNTAHMYILLIKTFWCRIISQTDKDEEGCYDRASCDIEDVVRTRDEKFDRVRY